MAFRVGDRVAYDAYTRAANTGTVVNVVVENKAGPTYGITLEVIVKPDDTDPLFAFDYAEHGRCWFFNISPDKDLKVLTNGQRPSSSQPCPNPTCAKPNDVGARTCWWCEGRLTG